MFICFVPAFKWGSFLQDRGNSSATHVKRHVVRIEDESQSLFITHYINMIWHGVNHCLFHCCCSSIQIDPPDGRQGQLDLVSFDHWDGEQEQHGQSAREWSATNSRRRVGTKRVLLVGGVLRSVDSLWWVSIGPESLHFIRCKVGLRSGCVDT